MAPADNDPAPAEPRYPTVPPAELIATVSHELRQPLSSIRGYTEMMLAHWGDFADLDKKDMLKEILHDAIRVGRLVDELLDVSRLEAGRVPLYRRPTNIGEVVARVLSNLRLSYPDLEAVVELPRRLPAVMADPFQLEQVVTNVVENACKHGSAGTVLIRARYRPGRARSSVEIAISDQGSGIAAEELPHVTEKFFRSTATTSHGLGLGLWVSKGIVEAHGGELAVTSAPGAGTTVRFTVPLDAAAPEALPVAGAERAAGGRKTPMRGSAATGKLTGS